MAKGDRLSSGKAQRHGPGKMHGGKPCNHVPQTATKSIEEITAELIAKSQESGRTGKRSDEL
jgi:hypothetical protein